MREIIIVIKMYALFLFVYNVIIISSGSGMLLPMEMGALHLIDLATQVAAPHVEINFLLNGFFSHYIIDYLVIIIFLLYMTCTAHLFVLAIPKILNENRLGRAIKNKPNDHLISRGTKLIPLNLCTGISLYVSCFLK